MENIGDNKYMLITILLSLLMILYLVCKFPQSYKKNKDNNTVRLPIYFYYILIIFEITILFFYCYNTKFMADYRAIEFFSYWFGNIFSFCIVLSQVNWAIYFDKNSNAFTYVSMFGKKTTICYKDITEVKRYKNGIFFKVEKRNYFIDTWSNNLDEFMVLFNLLTPQSSWKIR